MGDGDATLTKCSKNINDTDIAIALFSHIATALRMLYHCGAVDTFENAGIQLSKMKFLSCEDLTEREESREQNIIL